MPYKPDVDLERNLERFLPIVGYALFGILIVYSLLRDPPEPIPNSSAYGCYASQLRPSIFIDENGIQVVNSDLPNVSYTLDWDDEGITLWPEKRLQLVETSIRRSFEVLDEPGYAFRFVDVIDGNVYPDVDATRLDTFQLITSDHRLAAYSRTTLDNCND